MTWARLRRPCLTLDAHRIHIPTSRPVAIKQIDLEDSDDDIAEIQLEIAHLSDCDSEYVTRYYGSFLRGWKLWIGESTQLHGDDTVLTQIAGSDGVSRGRVLPRPRAASCFDESEIQADALTSSSFARLVFKTAQTWSVLRDAHRHRLS